MTSAIDLLALQKKCLEICNKHNWGRNWQEGGCYLHLESSEFIEALRGKGNNTPEEEDGDILFVLLAMFEEHGLDINKSFEYLRARLQIL